jgi:signal transduction histidine kinase
MEAMNGRIAASDTPGGGLTMTISLPTAQLRSDGPGRTAAEEPA